MLSNAIPALGLQGKYSQTANSMLLHMNSHVTSDCGLKGSTKVPRMMAKIMTKTVMQNTPAKASFCRRLV